MHRLRLSSNTAGVVRFNAATTRSDHARVSADGALRRAQRQLVGDTAIPTAGDPKTNGCDRSGTLTNHDISGHTMTHEEKGVRMGLTTQVFIQLSFRRSKF